MTSTSFKAVCMALTIGAMAQTVYANETYVIIGAISTCREWTSERAKARSERRLGRIEFAAPLKEQWVLGFISGQTLSNYSRLDPLQSVDADTIFDWMDKYCIANKEKDVIDGSAALLASLVNLRREEKKKKESVVEQDSVSSKSPP